MLLETARKAFNDGNYVAEPKIDGHRLLFSREGMKSELWTRHNTLVTNQYPELLDLQLKEDFYLDGEVCMSDPSGRVQFEMIMERIVQKFKHSKYEDKRSEKWLKVIRWEYAQTAVLGYNRKEFGWLLGVEEQGSYRAVGVMRLGTNPLQRKWFYAQSEKYITGKDNNFVIWIHKLKWS
ncbi:hypothetical protein P4H32_29380 [Bacillus cereus]|nr:hypothetical protein [Bacillus cereus]